jgi:hypothetical protein
MSSADYEEVVLSADIAKARIVAILLRDDDDNMANKAKVLQAVLDDYKGSYAVHYFLEALREMGGDNPTNVAFLRTSTNIAHAKAGHRLLDAIELLTPPSVPAIEQTLGEISGSLDQAGKHLQGTIADLGQLVAETNQWVVPGSVQNNMCDGGCCVTTDGEVRVLPLDEGSNLILCRACFEHEMAFRRDENKRVPVLYEILAWESLKVYKAK